MQEGDEPAILTGIKEMPKAVFDYLVGVHPHFEKRASKTAGSEYYMNTCDCGSHFGDFYLHSEPGGAFFPMSDDDAKQIIIEEMPFTGKFDFVSNYSLGVADVIFEHGQMRNKA
jgi:hypothetical protein